MLVKFSIRFLSRRSFVFLSGFNHLPISIQLFGWELVFNVTILSRLYYCAIAGLCCSTEDSFFHWVA